MGVHKHSQQRLRFIFCGLHHPSSSAAVQEHHSVRSTVIVPPVFTPVLNRNKLLKVIITTYLHTFVNVTEFYTPSLAACVLWGQTPVRSCDCGVRLVLFGLRGPLVLNRRHKFVTPPQGSYKTSPPTAED